MARSAKEIQEKIAEVAKLREAATTYTRRDQLREQMSYLLGELMLQREYEEREEDYRRMLDNIRFDARHCS